MSGQAPEKPRGRGAEEAARRDAISPRNANCYHIRAARRHPQSLPETQMSRSRNGDVGPL